MATPAQLEANRLNSQNSTGPRTDEGKAASSTNSLKHGLYARSVVIPGEDPAEYEAHAAAYRAQLKPQTVEEEFHVETMIEESWKRRRYSRVEAALARKIMEQAAPADDPLAIVFSGATPESRMLERVIRARQASTRAWERADREFQRLSGIRWAKQLVAEGVVVPFIRPKEASPAPPPPVTERSQSVAGFLQRNVSQPLHPGMSKEERERILALRL